MKNIAILILFLTCSLQAFSDNLSDSNKFFNWAEQNYAQYFSPPESVTFKVENYWVRHYKLTDIYLGTLGDDVYVYGDVFDGLKHAGKISDFIDLTENGFKEVGGFKIIGNQTFITQTEVALELLKNLAPNAFKKAQQYISVIEQAEYSHMWADEVPPKYTVNKKSAFKSVKWYAGTISHEATHSELYQAYLTTDGLPVPDHIWRSADAESFCLEYQIEVMTEMNAPQEEIDELNNELAGTNCELTDSC